MQLRLVVATAFLTTSLAAHAQPASKPRFPKPPGPVAPVLTDADAAWRAAETAAPADAPERWRVAARAYDAVAADARADSATRTEAAWIAVLAWKNALAVVPTVRLPAAGFDEPAPPAPLAPDDAALVASLSTFLALAPTSAEAPGVRFARANVWRHYRHDDEALADLRELIAKHLDHDVGPFAVNLALDLLNRARRYDELMALVAAVRDDPRLVDADLMQRLRVLQRQGLRVQAERAADAAMRTDDVALYAQCATFYEQAQALDPRGPDRDELVYNAGVCWLRAVDLDRARAALAPLLASKPPSRLASSARRIDAHLARLRGDLAIAAADLELTARLDRGVTAVDDMLDASRWRLALGEHDAATRNGRWLETSTKPTLASRVFVATARARLDAGDRRGARDDLRLAESTAGRDLDTRTEAALLGWDAACPVAPTDGLCRRGARYVRDAGFARNALISLTGDPRPEAAAIHATAGLEAALATRPLDRARVTAALVAVTAIADGPDDATAATAHAQRAVAARALGDTAGATAALDACAARARAHGLVDQHARCAPALAERRGGFAGAPLDPGLEATIAPPPPPPEP